MRRVPLAPALLAAVAVAALVLGLARPRAAAQAGTPPAGTPTTGTPPAVAGFVGAWRLTLASPGGASTPSLATFVADGTSLASDVPVYPASGGQPATVAGAGHGVWRQTGPATAAVTFVELQADVQGAYVGSVTVSARLALGADGNSFRGPYSVTAAAPGGEFLFAGGGTMAATRITLQPLASPGAAPAGTPAA